MPSVLYRCVCARAHVTLYTCLCYMLGQFANPCLGMIHDYFYFFKERFSLLLFCMFVSIHSSHMTFCSVFDYFFVRK